MTRARGWPLVILAAAIVLLAFAVLMPAVELFGEQSDELAQARRDFASFRAEIAARPRLKAELAAIDRQGVATAGLLQGDSGALASAGLQSIVKALVERHGGQVRSALSLPSTMSGGLERIVLQVELSLPAGGLKPAAYEIESGTPFLFIDEIEVRPELYAGDAMSAPTYLHVLWTIHGYRKIAAP